MGSFPITAIMRVPHAPRLDRAELRRYGVAIAVTMATVLASVAVDEMVHIRLHLVLVVAVSISAWYGGRGPGITAAILSLLAIIEHPMRNSPPAIDVPGVGKAAYLLTFLLVALIIGATTESLRYERAQANAKAATLENLNAEVEAQMEEVQTLTEDLQASNDSLSAALEESRSMAERGSRIQKVTAALARADTESEVAGVVLGAGLAAVGAQRGFLARADDDRVEILRAWGYDAESEALLLRSGAKLAVVARAVRVREPIWLRSPTTERAEYWARAAIAVTPLPQAAVAIPLVHDDAVVGVLALIFVDGPVIGPATESFALMLGHAAASALFRARNYDAERAARERAELLAQTRADVLAIVAHDLRNPLSVIVSSASLQLEIEDLAQQQRRRLLELTQRAGRQMHRLIEDLLDATRLQAGQLRLDLTEIDAGALVRDAGETLRPAAEEKGIELHAEAAPQTSILRGDEGRLHQVIANLVGNAIKFTGAGGHIVLSSHANDGEVVFSVADTGPGIPSESLTHLFDRFWQARKGDRRGVGLGLAITKGIVEAHGGRVWVESTVGAGSTFSFALPVTESPPA